MVKSSYIFRFILIGLFYHAVPNGASNFDNYYKINYNPNNVNVPPKIVCDSFSPENVLSQRLLPERKSQGLGLDQNSQSLSPERLSSRLLPKQNSPAFVLNRNSHRLSPERIFLPVFPERNSQLLLPERNFLRLVPERNYQHLLTERIPPHLLPHRNYQRFLPEPNSQPLFSERIILRLLPDRNSQSLLPERISPQLLPQPNSPQLLQERLSVRILPDENSQRALPERNSQSVLSERKSPQLLQKNSYQYPNTKRNNDGESQLGSRIVGGQYMSIRDIPYQVSIQYHYIHFCGGAVISPYHIVTAAHCTYNKKSEDLNIRAGSSYDNNGGVVRTVAQIFTHIAFNKTIGDFDIALLKLSEPLRFSEYIKPALLVDPCDWLAHVYGTPVLVSGWGYKNENEKNVDHSLEAVGLEILDNNVCKSRFQTFYTNNMICAGLKTLSGGKDSCHGDSGGPLVTGDGKLIGIVSFGSGCARPGIPGVYTSIAKLRGFIEYMMLW